MTGSTHQFSGTTFNSVLQRPFPAITGLKTMAFFGTGYDAGEANRVAGGPALSVLSGTPVHSANFVSVGHQPAGSPTRFDVIDTNNVRDASWLTSGWTYMACVRNVLGSGSEFANYSVVFTEQNQVTGATAVSGFGIRASSNALVLFRQGIAGTLTLSFAQPASNWHICACVVPAGASTGLVQTGWEFTENQAGQSVSGTLGSSYNTAVAGLSPHLGCHTNDNTAGFGPIDVAWAMVAQSALSQVTMAAIATSVRAILARRQIVC